jgi:hypothetical protein
MRCYTRALVVVAALTLSCGDDDKPTASSGSSEIIGSWEGEGLAWTFRDDGTYSVAVEGVTITGDWSATPSTLTLELAGGTFRPTIADGFLTFEAVVFGISDLSGFVFVGTGELVGTRWLDEDGCILQLHADGTFHWGEGDFTFEEGRWEQVDEDIRIILSTSGPYSVDGDELSLLDPTDPEDSAVLRRTD